MEHRTRSSTTDTPALDTIYALLSDQYRRSVVTVISERDPPIALRELAKAVASREAEIESGDAPGERIESVEVTLHHIHLPRLDDADVIDYDAETKAVTSAHTEELVSIMELADGVR